MTDSSELYLWMLLLVMAVINYLLRVLPATVFSKVKFGRYMRRVLNLIPYTALTALVFPGIFFSVGDHTYIAMAGTLVAVITAILRFPLSVSVIITVMAVIGMLVCGS